MPGIEPVTFRNEDLESARLLQRVCEIQNIVEEGTMAGKSPQEILLEMHDKGPPREVSARGSEASVSTSEMSKQHGGSRHVQERSERRGRSSGCRRKLRPAVGV
jgi:hypothetical protein